MADVLMYVRRYEPRRRDHYSNSPVIGGLVAGDGVWFVTSGRFLGREEKRAGFLVAIGKVAGVAENPGDDPAYARDDYRYKIVLDEAESLDFDSVPVDHLLRPEGRDDSIPIGRFVSVPRRLDEQLVRKLRAAAGPELALRWLTGKR